MASTTTSMEHSADEAGGEAVFTSDGLPTLAAPLPPPPLPSVGGVGPGVLTTSAAAAVDDDAVIEEESDPRAAFEAFTETRGGWAASSAAPSIGEPSAWEDPRRRLFRLKSEIDEVEATLAGEKGAGGGEDDENLRAAAAELRSRLDALGMADLASVATMLRGRQEDLSGVIARDLERFGAAREEGGLAMAMDGMSLKGESKEESKTPGDGRIVYELYRDSASAVVASGASAVPREAMLEERLRRLELVVGTAITEGDKKSVMDRIEEAERLAGEVDARRIEKLAAKAKVVRADLEAAARARSKLASKSSSGDARAGGQKQEDSRTIAALHDQMTELEGISAHLPALAVRLLELSNLHSNAAEFASRLEAAEGAVNRSEVVLTSVEGVLKKMEGGWKENMESVEKNVERLDKILSKSAP